MTSRKNINIPIWYLFCIAWAVVIMLLIKATTRNVYDYYVVLRYIVCIVALFSVWFAYRCKNKIYLFVFLTAAILFNPIAPVFLKRYIWTYIDLITAIVFASSFFFLKLKKVANGNATMAPRTKNSSSIKDRLPRERELWESPLNRRELNEIKNNIIHELKIMKPTDWGDYVLRAICTHSPSLSKFVIDGRIDIDSINEHERKGIGDAIDAIRDTDVEDECSLREYVQQTIKNIYHKTSYGQGNKFYFFGRDRVIEGLRRYVASMRKIIPAEMTFYDVDGDTVSLDTNITAEVIDKIKKALDTFDQRSEQNAEKCVLKEYYKFKLESKFPIIEYDLDAIREAAVFKYEGSLVNSLYIEMQRLLSISTDHTYPEIRLNTQPLFDAEASTFVYENGLVTLVRYKGTVEYFPDRLYVELQDIDSKSWIIKWLKSYKMHIEGND